ncbi:MAG: Zn-ribbon domain-containing OB-fold protein [Anaerolineales bacterium]
MTVRFKSFPGVALNEEDFRQGKVLYQMDELKAEYAWDSGIAIGTYLAGLKRGVILGVRCSHCRRIVVPPRTVCEWCFRPMEEYVELADTGTVNTFSLCYISWDMRRLSEPEIPAVIHIDGTSELGPASVVMGGIMHKLGEVDPKEVHIGMRVQAVWKPAEERSGAITDILYFKPIR